MSNRFQNYAVVITLLVLGYACNNDPRVIYGKLPNATGIKIGTSVNYNGIQIGEVTHLDLDPVLHDIILQIEIDEGYKKLPGEPAWYVANQDILGTQAIVINTKSEVKNYVDFGDTIAIQPLSGGLDTSRVNKILDGLDHLMEDFKTSGN